MSRRLSDIPTGSVERDAAAIQELLQYSDDLQIKDLRRDCEQVNRSDSLKKQPLTMVQPE